MIEQKHSFLRISRGVITPIVLFVAGTGVAVGIVTENHLHIVDRIHHSQKTEPNNKQVKLSAKKDEILVKKEDQRAAENLFIEFNQCVKIMGRFQVKDQNGTTHVRISKTDSVIEMEIDATDTRTFKVTPTTNIIPIRDIYTITTSEVTRRSEVITDLNEGGWKEIENKKLNSFEIDGLRSILEKAVDTKLHPQIPTPYPQPIPTPDLDRSDGNRV